MNPSGENNLGRIFEMIRLQLQESLPMKPFDLWAMIDKNNATQKYIEDIQIGKGWMKKDEDKMDAIENLHDFENCVDDM